MRRWHGHADGWHLTATKNASHPPSKLITAVPFAGSALARIGLATVGARFTRRRYLAQHDLPPEIARATAGAAEIRWLLGLESGARQPGAGQVIHRATMPGCPVTRKPAPCQSLLPYRSFCQLIRPGSGTNRAVTCCLPAIASHGDGPE